MRFGQQNNPLELLLVEDSGNMEKTYYKGKHFLKVGTHSVFNNVSDILILSSFVPLGLAYCASPCQAAANAARNFYALRTKLQYCSSAKQKGSKYINEGTRTRDIAFYGKDVSLAITVYQYCAIPMFYQRLLIVFHYIINQALHTVYWRRRRRRQRRRQLTQYDLRIVYLVFSPSPSIYIYYIFL